MKKFFDRYLISKLGIQLLIVIGVICVISVITGFCLELIAKQSISQENWFFNSIHGFFQLIDSEVVRGTVQTLEDMGRKKPENQTYVFLAISLSLIIWFFGTILFSFVTAAFANGFDNRKNRIASGQTRYKFSGQHGVIIGWNFHGIAIVKALLEQYCTPEIVILSSKMSFDILEELRREISPIDLKKIYIYCGNCLSRRDICSLYVWRAQVVFIAGEQEACSSNERTYLILEDIIDEKLGVLSDYSRFAQQLPSKHPLINWFISWRLLDFAARCFCRIRHPFHPLTYGCSFREHCFNWCQKACFPSQKIKIFLNLTEPEKCCTGVNIASPQVTGFIDLNVYNYCSASFRELYCSIPAVVNSGNCERYFSYTPLNFRAIGCDSYAHLFISNFNNMGKTIVFEALSIWANSSIPHQITIFNAGKNEQDEFLNQAYWKENSAVKIEFVNGTIYSTDVRQRLIEAVQNIKASVTIFLTGDSPEEVTRDFYRLPPEIKNENIRLVLEQQVMQKKIVPRQNMQQHGFHFINYIGLYDKFCSTIKEQYEFADAEKQLSGRGRETMPSHLGILEDVCSRGKIIRNRSAVADSGTTRDRNDEILSLLNYQVENCPVLGVLPSRSERFPEFVKTEIVQRCFKTKKAQLQRIVLCCMEDVLGQNIMQEAFCHNVPVIGIFRREPGEIAAGLTKEKSEKFLHNCRKLHSYMVLPEQIDSYEFIIRHSDCLLADCGTDLNKFQEIYFSAAHSEIQTTDEFPNVLPLQNVRKFFYIMQESGDEWLLGFPLSKQGDIDDGVLRANRNYACTVRGRIGEIFSLQGDFSKAMKIFRMVRKCNNNIIEKALLQCLMGRCCQELKKYSAALKYFKSADRILKRCEKFPVCYEYRIKLLNDWANLLLDQGLPRKALRLHEKVLNRRCKLYGSQHRKTAKSHLNIGKCWTELKKYDRAERILRDTLELRIRFWGEESLAAIYANYYLARNYLNAGKIDEALQEALKVKDIGEKVLGSRHRLLAVSYQLLVEIYRKCKDESNLRKYEQLFLELVEKK